MKICDCTIYVLRNSFFGSYSCELQINAIEELL